MRKFICWLFCFGEVKWYFIIIDSNCPNVTSFKKTKLTILNKCCWCSFGALMPLTVKHAEASDLPVCVHSNHLEQESTFDCNGFWQDDKVKLFETTTEQQWQSEVKVKKTVGNCYKQFSFYLICMWLFKLRYKRVGTHIQACKNVSINVSVWIHFVMMSVGMLHILLSQKKKNTLKHTMSSDVATSVISVNRLS